MTRQSNLTSPFLLKFARPCNTRKSAAPVTGIFYDEQSDMLRIRQPSASPLLIDVPAIAGPRTKKNDIERGEDQKDRRMWR